MVAAVSLPLPPPPLVFREDRRRTSDLAKLGSAEQLAAMQLTNMQLVILNGLYAGCEARDPPLLCPSASQRRCICLKVSRVSRFAMLPRGVEGPVLTGIRTRLSLACGGYGKPWLNYWE